MANLIKGNPVDITGKEVVIFYGLGFSNPILASKINRYMFSLNQNLMRKLLVVAFNGQKMPKWIKKPKDEKEGEIDKFCKENHIERSAVVERLIQENYGEFLHEIRADEKMFEKAGIQLPRPETNEWF